jgi:transposase
MESKELKNRKKILSFSLENPGSSSSSIAKKLKLPKSTVCSVIKRYNQSLTMDRSPGSGRPAGPVDKNLTKRVVRSFKVNPGLSDNDRAEKYKTSRTNVQNIRSRAGWKSYRAIKQPNRNDKQNLRAKQRAGLLLKNVLTKFRGCILMDDETYVKNDFKQLPGQKFYISTMRGNVPDRYKFVHQEKYAKKLMIWQAICSCGIKSQAFVTSLKMNRQLYIKECLEKRVLPIIRSHNVPVKFWPDLTSCHYAKDTMNWYETNQVDVIPKDMNPPNCPQLRPIEQFWAIVKRKLKKSGKSATDAKQMLQKWNFHAGKVSTELVQKLMGSITKHVREFMLSE